jgi:hypothetical protein
MYNIYTFRLHETQPTSKESAYISVKIVIKSLKVGWNRPGISGLRRAGDFFCGRKYVTTTG